MIESYPYLRLRRTRASAWNRSLPRETVITPADLIWPLFVTAGSDAEEPIATLPGVSRWSVDGSPNGRRKRSASGFRAFALFANTPQGKLSDDGAEALNPDNLMSRAIKAIKDACGEDLGVLTDAALDPCTSHGQDGLLDDRGYVTNDDTVAVLVDQAINHSSTDALSLGAQQHLLRHLGDEGIRSSCFRRARFQVILCQISGTGEPEAAVLVFLHAPIWLYGATPSRESPTPCFSPTHCG